MPCCVYGKVYSENSLRHGALEIGLSLFPHIGTASVSSALWRDLWPVMTNNVPYPPRLSLCHFFSCSETDWYCREWDSVTSPLFKTGHRLHLQNWEQRMFASASSSIAFTGGAVSGHKETAWNSRKIFRTFLNTTHMWNFVWRCIIDWWCMNSVLLVCVNGYKCFYIWNFEVMSEKFNMYPADGCRKFLHSVGT